MGAYGVVVNTYCQHVHTASMGPMRIASSLLYGMVPFSTSVGSYLVALIVTDFDSWASSLAWSRTTQGRAAALLAVLPGLCHSLYLCSTVSTGFEAAGTIFDVLSWCLFIDVARGVGHLTFLLVPDYAHLAIARVAVALCLGWLAVLGHCEAVESHGFLGFTPDRIKRNVLACLASYSLLPSAAAVAVPRLTAALRAASHPTDGELAQASYLALWLALAACLIVVGVHFNAAGPNLLGCATLLGCAFFAAFRFGSQSILSFTAILFGCALILSAAIAS
eukprot:5110581-Prymnesium_polylepis.1